MSIVEIIHEYKKKKQIKNKHIKTSYVFLPVILTVALNLGVMINDKLEVYADNSDNICICIDPGHGGENLGAEWQDYTEKDMTLAVALTMKEELEKYEGIEVYITRTEDKDLTLEERIDYAKSVNADFFFCLHFNMSVNHDLYGAENWISAFGKNYARGMDFARIEMSLLTELGLYDRGIKTRLNSKGTNYYGVLRLGDEADIPGVIIEHCYLDNINDEPFYDMDQWLEDYGRLDARAVAMYYGLASETLGIDYGDYQYERTPIPDKRMDPDKTEPEYCKVEAGEMKCEEICNEDGVVQDYRLSIPLKIEAYDPDTRMLYYMISTDGGKTISEMYKWDSSNDQIEVEVELPFDRDIDLNVYAVNMYDLIKESDTYHISGIARPIIETTEQAVSDSVNDYSSYEDYVTISPYDNKELNDQSDSYVIDSSMIIAFAIVAILVLVILVCLALFTVWHYSNRR